MAIVEIELAEPVTHDGTKMTVMRMREPKVKDQLAVEKATGTDAEKQVNLIANLCEVSPELISEITMRDYKKLAETLESFLD